MVEIEHSCQQKFSLFFVALSICMAFFLNVNHDVGYVVGFNQESVVLPPETPKAELKMSGSKAGSGSFPPEDGIPWHGKDS